MPAATCPAYRELLVTIRGLRQCDEIKRLCSVLVGCLSTIARHAHAFAELVQALFRVEWVRRHDGANVMGTGPESVAQAYVAMLGHLVSTNLGHLAFISFISNCWARRWGARATKGAVKVSPHARGCSPWATRSNW